MKNPKAKGAAAEREVAKKLSLWWSEGKADDIFYLTAGSGARQTTRRKQGQTTANSAGDLNYLDIKGKPLIDSMLFEIKRGYNSLIDVLAIVDSKVTRKPNIIMQWIEKAEKERKENKRDFIFLIIKRDHKEYFVIFPNIFRMCMAQTNGEEFKYHPLPVTRSINLVGKYTLLPLKDFFLWANPNAVRKMLKNVAKYQP